MNQGIYIMVNDKVIDYAIALLNSIRNYDVETPIVAIPYDDNYRKAAKILKDLHGVRIYEDLQTIEYLIKEIHRIFGKRFFARPNQFRKQACWFGTFDKFLYIDADIIVFEKIINNLKYLSKYDFVSCDYQYLNGIKYIFTKKVLEDNIFSEKDINDVFNAGFWGSKKDLITKNDLCEVFEECRSHIEYFDFSQKVSDMPIINYLVLRLIKKRFNIARDAGKNGVGNWAGSSHFIRKDNLLIDANVNQPLKYLHWAGIKIKLGCPYWDIWRYYRFLNKKVKAMSISKPKTNE